MVIINMNKYGHLNNKFQELELLLTEREWHKDIDKFSHKEETIFVFLGILTNMGHKLHYKVSLFYILKIKVPWIRSSKHNKNEIKN